MIRTTSSKLLMVMMLTFLLTAGCGVFQNSKPHYTSCGPNAIFYAFRWHGIESSRYKISREILEDHKAYSLLRDALSIFHADLKGVTFPKEIKSELNKHGINVRPVLLGEFMELKKDENTTAIILVHTKGKINYHWFFYPTQSDSPSDYFGSRLNTSVDKIYILTRAI